MPNHQSQHPFFISAQKNMFKKGTMLSAIGCIAFINVSCSSGARINNTTGVVPQHTYPYSVDKSNRNDQQANKHSNHYGWYDNRHTEHTHNHDDSFEDSGLPNFKSWLKKHPYYQPQVYAYRDYLMQQLGKKDVPPISQLIRTARSWEKCGAEPYQVPPRYLWSNIVPTLRLYNDLKAQGIVPKNSVIRSVYRDYDLNRCAGGAKSSKHLENAAIDIWVPSYEYNQWKQDSLKENLCQFWLYQGQSYNFGLGIYSTGAIHLDTQKYRKWGGQFTPSYSACRY